MDDPFTPRLSEYLDDELEAGERRTIDAHLRSCDACRAVLGELREVKDRAASLAVTSPDADLWPGILARIEAPSRRIVPFATRTPRRISFTIPQFVAASLALMIVSGGMVWLLRAGGPRTDVAPVSGATRQVAPEITPANFADPQYDRAIADLEQLLQVGRGRLDPETIRVLEANLESIDRAIEQCRQALEVDPANFYLNAHLAQSRQRKLALLRRATALAGSESSS